MSTRPTILTVFGVDDYEGACLPGDVWDERVPSSLVTHRGTSDFAFLRDYLFDWETGEGKWYSEVLFVGHSQANQGVLGLVKSCDFDSDTFRVLAMMHPQFMQSGHWDVPLEEEDLQKLRWRSHPAISCGGIEFQPSWFYPQGYHILTPVWAFVTFKLFESVGIEIDPKRYKWMLVWEWG